MDSNCFLHPTFWHNFRIDYNLNCGLVEMYKKHKKSIRANGYLWNRVPTTKYIWGFMNNLEKQIKSASAFFLNKT